MKRVLGSATRYSASILTVCGVFLVSGTASGSGGTCPTGANYLNTTTNTLTTLSSLGVTNCYYVAANGSDSNAGTSESTPWLHAPQMPNCSGSCATVQNQSNGIPPGTGLILRGGDTWHFGNSGASPYTGGTWNFNSGQYPEGTSSNPIYVGVDQGWYSGSSWARPILTGDNPLSSGMNSYVASCAYPSIGSANVMVSFSNRPYFIFDNFELLGLCQSDNGAPFGADDFITYGTTPTTTFLNLYIHGWSHIQFYSTTSPVSCGSGAGVTCFNMFAFSGAKEIVRNVVVDGSDSDPRGAGVVYGGFANTAYSIFRYVSQFIVGSFHVYHDNLVEYFYDNGHGNVLESVGDATGPANVIYNNVWRTIPGSDWSSPGPQGIWLQPGTSTTDYFFDNEISSINGNTWNCILCVGQSGTNTGNYVFFNNTFETDTSHVLFSCSNLQYGMLYDINNLLIDAVSPYGCSSQRVSTTSLSWTNSTATSNGYTASETYPYSPPNGSAPTVGTGTNEGTQNLAFCTALSTAAASDSTLSDAASACLQDTRYACTYNTTNHTVTCPARTAMARPSSGNWDIGAYQSGDPDPPQPPSNVQATAH